jgi:hypothetical protein
MGIKDEVHESGGAWRETPHPLIGWLKTTDLAETRREARETSTPPSSLQGGLLHSASICHQSNSGLIPERQLSIHLTPSNINNSCGRRMGRSEQIDELGNFLRCGTSQMHASSSAQYPVSTQSQLLNLTYG